MILLSPDVEERAAGVAVRLQEGGVVHYGTLLVDVQLDLHTPQIGRDLPDVYECNAGEGTSPAYGVWYATERGGNDVAQRLPHAEAFVGVFPETVDGMSGVWLTYRLLEAHLQKEK